MRRSVLSGLLVLLVAAAAGAARLNAARPAQAGTCAERQPEWLMCEDFEGGGLGWATWFSRSAFTECNGCGNGVNNPARIRLDHDAERAHTGEWSLELPAEASAGYQGASLTYRSCAGRKREGCQLTGYEQLYFRSWVKLAADHQMVHHFLDISGTRPNAYWESDGNAGCRPDGLRWAGSTLDFDRSHQLFFYTYFPEMKCDRGNYCSGDYVKQLCSQCATKNMPCRTEPECCWGNIFRPSPGVALARDRWVCLEMTVKLNAPGQADGSMAFWVDDTLALDQGGMHWRDVASLQLNKAWLQHYIATGDAQQSNRIWFDDMVVSTKRIGCGPAPSAPSPTDVPDLPTANPTPAPTLAPSQTPRPAATATGAPLPSAVPTTVPIPVAPSARVYLPRTDR